VSGWEGRGGRVLFNLFHLLVSLKYCEVVCSAFVFVA
jgi:hypothetical protein